MMRRQINWGWIIVGLVLAACQMETEEAPHDKPALPSGYVSRIEIQVDDRVLSFGPFVGYYFKPSSGEDLYLLDFVCFNERSFYTRDLPANTLLYKGQARWQRLPDTEDPLPTGNERIIPVFFTQAPKAWLNSRPDPKEEYVHFHSAYDGRGAVRYGYWLRHVAQVAFTYDMGGRVSQGSPLYHMVEPGRDRKFARIIEFDSGPAN